jgi:PAS domain S-box-containing protein
MTTVLVVDDDPNIRELMQFGLEDEGYSVLTAPNGQAALDVLGGDQSVNLILLDMGMPVMDGWTFARNYHRQQPPWAPVVVVTAAHDASRPAAEIGADAHLNKPFEWLDLLATIEQTLQPQERFDARGPDAPVLDEISEQGLRVILDSMIDPLFAIDANWHISYLNPVAVQLLWRHEKLLGRQLWEVCPEFIGSDFETPLRRALRDRVPVEFEAFYRPIESWFAVRVFPSKVGGLAVHLRSVTEQREVDEARARLGAIVECSTDAIISKALDGTITSWNQAAQRLYGYAAAEALGCSIGMLVPADRSDEAPALIERIRRGEHVSHYETERVHKDGRRLMISLSLSPVRNGSGSIVGAAIIARDITEHNRAELMLAQQLAATQEARREAETALRLRDEFLSIAAHELKTPVTAITLAAQMLSSPRAQAGQDRQRMNRTIHTLQAGASRLARLTEDLLDVARLETGHLGIRAVELDVSELLQRVVAPYRLRLTPGQKLQVEGARTPYRLMGDPDRLQQVFINLMDNSLKYSPGGGMIHVHIRPEKEGCLILVQDHGIGLPPGSAEAIFEPFGRAQNATTSQIAGMGLGLYISRQIVAAHDGRLWAESPGVNLGTLMHLWLPWRGAEPSLARTGNSSEVTDVHAETQAS